VFIIVNVILRDFSSLSVDEEALIRKCRKIQERVSKR